VKKINYPVFFPDATRAVLKATDSTDIKGTNTPGILVNTLHLSINPGGRIIDKYQGVRKFMNWDGFVISDSGGFQVMSMAKSGPRKGTITDRGVTFYLTNNKKILLTPEKSIEFQFRLRTDMMVVLDDFTPPKANFNEARETVERTVLWAKRSKDEFEKQCVERKLKDKPLLFGVVQGGEYLDLRRICAEKLIEIGFDGLGYGGWPISENGKFNYDVAKLIADIAPKNYLIYGLGVGKPEEIVGCVQLGYHIFDCVLPTRDARHGRLYIYEATSMDKINIRSPKFYKYYVPSKQEHFGDTRPVSQACDCLLCKNYSRGYLAHLFRIKEISALRLATIHNLRFYSILMEKLASTPAKITQA